MTSNHHHQLDYSLDSPEERKKLVQKIIEETPSEKLTPRYLDILSDYLVLCMEKQEKRQKKILTDNRLITVNKRETSYEGLAESLENGEDGIYNMSKDNDKSILFKPKISITKKDLATIPYLAQLRSTIEQWDAHRKNISGKDAFTMKKALIEMRKDQYVIKQAYQRPIQFIHVFNNTPPIRTFEDSYCLNDGKVSTTGTSFANPQIAGLILQNYSKLRQAGVGNFKDDTYYMMEDFDELVDYALADYPVYLTIVTSKIDGKTNAEIHSLLLSQHNINYSHEYISSLWRNKIPRVIAAQAENEIVIRTYRKQGKRFKKCSRCGQIKPIHSNFFTKNKTSKDGFYSICKKCRAEIRKERKMNVGHTITSYQES